MDALFSKKTALKRRDSLSLLFGSQQPTFATLNEKPTRYYDFSDTPASRFSSPKVDRQEISPELESSIRYACSLLAYRIEQGVPSRPSQASARAVGHVATSKARPGSSAKTGYDSGVGLTQQPSMQTMRILHSRCGEPSDSGANTTTHSGSIFSNTRTGTSCTNTSALNSAEPSCTQSSSHSPRQDELQTMTATTISDSVHNNATKTFLTESSASESRKKHTTLTDTEAFLNPTTSTKITNLSSETLQTNSSKHSLLLSRVPAQIQNHEDVFIPESTPKSRKHTKSIIIDAAGNPRLLSPDEESQRNQALQNAVLTKMTPGLMRYHFTRESTKTSNGEHSPNYNNEAEALSRSRLGLSWFGKGSVRNDLKSASKALKRKIRGQWSDGGSRAKDKGEAPVLGRLSGLISRREKI
ncbi:hypothetical protein BJY04DRAFT_203235 [Aspergillus karnatakaensis]|uniref:uncharacterized protein n=1 Tax=Aspergillus karnatakaensis TaxID=1810916 RepID=UPI003CCCFCE6